MATEHVPTLSRKLVAYLDFTARDGRGPGGVMPRVLVSVPNEKREAAVAGVIRSLPEPASQLLHVTTHAVAPKYLLKVLRE